MQRTLLSLLIAFLCLSTSTHAAREILLRLQPAPEAPVIAKVTASEKVLLDTAPAPSNAELGWRQMALPTPFEGYVPVATLGKNFEIVEGTAVQYLPTAESAPITRVEKGDQYEVVRVTEEWATVRFKKDITAYFLNDATEAVAIDFDSFQLTQTTTVPASTQPPKPIAFPEPVAIPAPRARVNPDQPIAQLDPHALPPENVNWQAAGSPAQKAPPLPAPSSPLPALGSDPIMVSPDQTQAREATPELGPAKTPRLLTGKLVREIHVDGPDYPIRLLSPEGRLIAYVDFSKIYVSDLAPYLNQKVYIRGQIYPLPNTHSQLVILAETLKLAPK